MRFQEFFQETFGHEPYNYQTRLQEVLLTGRNAVLIAPTGAGKTIAALAPFLYAKSIGKPLADRVIYTLPLRSLTSALYLSTQKALGKDGKFKPTIQMGNQPEDPYFEGDLVFTTIDQLLSAYIGLPYGTSNATANIPPGALIGALVVIDEFHLLSYQEALLTFLDMMKRLHPYTQFLVMTATVPTPTLQTIADRLNGVSITLTEAELRELPSKTRTLSWQDARLDAERVWQQRGTKTLVVVNTVQRAQALTRALNKLLSEQDQELEIRCLHSQLFASERTETEEWVLRRFAKEAKEPSLLIATQVVEAGLDISADVLLTELCPANAFLQRVGRCARFDKERGRVVVFSVEDENRRQDRPYPAELMKRTESFLKGCPEESVIQPTWEKELIEFVHGEYDAVQMQAALAHLQIRKKEIDFAYVHGKANRSKLVRSVDSLAVLIHPDPTQLQMELRPERVSVNFYKVHKFLRDHFGKKEGQLAPVGWYPDFEEDPWQREVLVWREIRSEKEIQGQWLICLAPPFVTYQSGVGLLFEQAEEGDMGVFSRERLTEPMPSSSQYDYFRETYLEHVQRVRSLYQEEEQRGVHEVANNKLSQALQLPLRTSLVRFAEFTGALHDIGKLNPRFQHALKAWQRDTRGLEEEEWLAHTDFDSTSLADREARKKAAYRKPNHAVEGARMALPLLSQMAALAADEEQMRLILNAMTLAIMRHHNAWSETCGEIDFDPRVTDVVQESLVGLFDGELILVRKGYGYDEQEDLIHPTFLALYWYLVRRLRLNDQRSLRQLTEERKSEVTPNHAI